MKESSLLAENTARILINLHAILRKAVAEGGRTPSGHTNPKGDVSFGFDLISDERARQFLARELGPVRILSEEAGVVDTGESEPRWRVILDPVDGSDNQARGLPLSAVSVALLPAEGPLHPSLIEWALVGGIEEETPLLAARGRGACRGSVRQRVSGVSRLEDALISLELNHFAPPPYVGALMARARGVRSYGCASRAISLVAEGSLDAHLDVRDRLTPESFFAAARILEEAGGCLVGPDGRELGRAEGLTHRMSLIAAASRELAHEIAEALSHGEK
ncbi:MAG: inositol monophosphatase family protein [bacterium]